MPFYTDLHSNVRKLYLTNEIPTVVSINTTRIKSVRTINNKYINNPPIKGI